MRVIPGGQAKNIITNDTGDVAFDVSQYMHID